MFASAWLVNQIQRHISHACRCIINFLRCLSKLKHCIHCSPVQRGNFYCKFCNSGPAILPLLIPPLFKSGAVQPIIVRTDLKNPPGTVCTVLRKLVLHLTYCSGCRNIKPDTSPASPTSRQLTPGERSFFPLPVWWEQLRGRLKILSKRHSIHNQIQVNSPPHSLIVHNSVTSQILQWRHTPKLTI